MSEASISADMTSTETPTVEKPVWPQRHPSFAVRSFGLTDRGQVRETNEDQYVNEPRARRRSV